MLSDLKRLDFVRKNTKMGIHIELSTKSIYQAYS